MNNNSFAKAAALTAAIGLSIFGAAAAYAAAPITAEEAQAIALKYEGISENEARHIQVKPDYDDGRAIYEVEFYAAGREHDFDISQDTGEVLKHSSDKKHHRRHGQRHTSAKLTLDEARAQALARVPGADHSHIRIHRDHDDGRLTYDGDIHYNGYEYDFEIDAVTGEFVKWEKDRD